MTWRRVASTAVELAAGGVLVVTVLAVVAGGTWPIGLLEHFRLQVLVVAVVVGAGAVGLRRWIALDLCAFACAGQLIYVAPALGGRDDNFGLAIYARGELRGTVEDLGGALPSIVADAHGATWILTHPPPPIRREMYEAQLRQLDAVAARVRGLDGPVIVLGDLNATPWSRPFARLGLLDSRAGFGVQASFPAGSSLLRIPIDHPDVGSDHLPVVVELAVPPDDRHRDHAEEHGEP